MTRLNTLLTEPHIDHRTAQLDDIVIRVYSYEHRYKSMATHVGSWAAIILIRGIDHHGPWEIQWVLTVRDKRSRGIDL